MLFCYHKQDGSLGQVEIELSDDFSFDDAVEYLKEELKLDKKTQVLGVLTGKDFNNIDKEIK